MDHIYHNIEGWFNFPKLYSEMVQRFDSGSKFVEIGTYLGKSASYMAVEIINSKKDIKFYCIDSWSGESEDKMVYAKSVNNSFYKAFLKNINDVKDYIIPVQDSSIKASTLFEDLSLDFIFLDASHDYKSVKEDILTWYPKLKKTGVLAGHDYDKKVDGILQVKQAVDEFCSFHNFKLEYQEKSWVIRDLN